MQFRRAAREVLAELHSKPTKQAFILEQEDGGLRWETPGREGMGAR